MRYQAALRPELVIFYISRGFLATLKQLMIIITNDFVLQYLNLPCIKYVIEREK